MDTEQVCLQVFEIDCNGLYTRYRDAQGVAFMRLIPPGATRVKAPAVKSQMTARPGGCSFVYSALDGKTICMLSLRQPPDEAEVPSTIVHLYWEPEAASFASGFLDWLRANFRTNDKAEQLTRKERERLEILEQWPASGLTKEEYAEARHYDPKTFRQWARELAQKGYETEFYLADRNKSANVR